MLGLWSILKEHPIKWARKNRMIGDCMTWQETCGNGVLIIGAMITVVELIVSVHPVNLGQFVVDVGGAPPWIVVQAIDKKQIKIIPARQLVYE